MLEFFDRFLLPGDYVIVEDTTENTPQTAGQGLFEELGYQKSGPGKMIALNAFMKEHSDRYVVDQHYTDFFG